MNDASDRATLDGVLAHVDGARLEISPAEASSILDRLMCDVEDTLAPFAGAHPRARHPSRADAIRMHALSAASVMATVMRLLGVVVVGSACKDCGGKGKVSVQSLVPDVTCITCEGTGIV